MIPGITGRAVAWNAILLRTHTHAHRSQAGETHNHVVFTQRSVWSEARRVPEETWSGVRGHCHMTEQDSNLPRCADIPTQLFLLHSFAFV